ncbi:MAG: GDP-mannose 4,6-dehydratase [Chitinophagaceae bacterium]
MKAVIWGSAGQDGYYLGKLLEAKGIEVIGISRSYPATFIDITSINAVSSLIKQEKPDYVFDFAANSTTRHEVWAENHQTIATGSLNLLEAVKVHSPGTRLFLSGSGLQFHNDGTPISEDTPFDATSMYAASRIYTTYAARYYRTLGVNVYMGYFFTHDSPLRSERHVNKKIADTAQRIASGNKEYLEIGDVTVRKEFGFAGDIVKAVWTLVNQETVTEAVIGTGRSYAIADWLQICFSRFGLNWQEHIRIREGFKAEYPVLVSNPARIFGLGWRPETTIEELANLMSA